MSNLFHRPTLFVGIGGSGIKSLALLKMQMIEEYHAHPNYTLQQFYENEFIFIDTTDEDFELINKKYAPQLESLKFRSTDLIDLSSEALITGNINPRQKALNRRGADPQFKKWCAWNEDVALGKNQKYTYEVPTSAKDGAAANRMNGRIIYTEASRDIERKIDGKMTNWKSRPGIQAIANNEDPACIWVISGTNGGTGSSFTLDLLYVLREYSRKHFLNADPYINLALLAPEPYVQRNKGAFQYPLNSYAFFKEMNFFSSQGDGKPNYHEYKDFYVKSREGEKAFQINNNSTTFRPYDLAIMFDTTINGTDATISVDNTFENVAKTLFLFNCHEVGSELRTKLVTNIIKPGLKLLSVTRPNSPIKGSKWSNDVVASGSTTLKTPITYFEEYLRTKLQYDLLSGLIGVEEPTNEVIFDFVQELIPSIAKIIESDPLFQQVFKLKNTPTDSGKKEYSRNLDAFKSEASRKIVRLQADYLDVYSDFSYNVLLDRINSELSDKFEQMILKFGFKYLDNFIELLDQYLSRDIKALDSECAWSKLMARKTALEKTVENKTVDLNDFEGLKRTEKAYLDGEKNKFLIKTQADLVHRLYYSRNPNEGSGGLLDELRDNGKGKGVKLCLMKLEDDKTEFKKMFKELCERMQKIENEKPFEIYLPSLKEQCSPDSEFSREYAQLVSYDFNSDKLNRLGTNGLESLIDEILKLKNRYSNAYPSLIKSSNEIQSSSFFTISTKSDKFNWPQIAKAISSLAYIKVDEFKKKSQFLQTTLIERVGQNLDSLRKIFREQDYITLPHSGASVQKQVIYSWPDNLPETQKFYQDLNINTKAVEVILNQTSFNKHEFSKIVFEAGLTFADYRHIDEYAQAHRDNLSGNGIHPAESLWTNPLAYMNRHFIWEDWETVKQSMGIKKDVNSFVELAFYSAVLELLKEKESSYFNKIVIQRSTVEEKDDWEVEGLADETIKDEIFLFADSQQKRIMIPVVADDNSGWKTKIEFDTLNAKFSYPNLEYYTISEKNWTKAIETLNNIVRETVDIIKINFKTCDINSINYINNELLTKDNDKKIRDSIYQKVLLIKIVDNKNKVRTEDFEWTTPELNSARSWIDSTIDELFKKQIK